MADSIRQNSVAVSQHRRKSVINDKGLTGASALTVRQSIWPITLVTLLFFLWGFAYGRCSRAVNDLGLSSLICSNRTPRCFERQIPDSLGHNCCQSWWSTGFILRCLFRWSFNLFWLDCETLGLSMDIHHRPIDLRRWCSYVLAFRRL